jgi:metal-responsive CopG/Arc/MetJ family transcriptional regulator
MVRVQPDLMGKIDAWADANDVPSRPEAIRRLVDQALESPKRKRP